MSKIILRHALYGGLFVTLFFLGPIVAFPGNYMDPEYYTMGEVIGYSIMILSMLPVYFGTRAYRNRLPEPSFSFRQALGVALAITVLACIIFYGGNVIVYEWLAPDFLGEFTVNYRENLLPTAETQAEREAYLVQFEKEAGMLSNSYIYALVMAGTVFFIGLIVSLISALVLHHREGRTGAR